jgi:hypothetical protein
MHTINAAGFTAPSVIQPLAPHGHLWREVPLPQMMLAHPGIICGTRFILPARGFSVMSTVENVDDGHGGIPEPHYHISMTRLTRIVAGIGETARVDMNDARWILRCFELDGWEEDNHVHEGKARNFWRPVADKHVGRECPCKATEPVIREDKGDYIWRPAD